MEKIQELINGLGLDSKITLDDIPDIDLYMDQVIQLFENKFHMSKRNEEEKVLTKTMINNYAKGKLFFPIKNKKYSKEHLILISLIYHLKGALSINDIKSTLDGVNKELVEGELDLDILYNSFLSLTNQNKEHFIVSLKESANEANEEVGKIESKETEYFANVLLILSLVNMSSLYRRAAEKLVDQLIKKDTHE